MSKQYFGRKSGAIDKELKSLDGEMASLLYSEAHEVPEGFFKEQKESLLMNIDKKGAVTVHPARNLKWKKSLGIAASFVILIFMGYGIFMPSHKTEGLDQFDIATIEEYLLDENEYLDTDLAVSTEILEIIDTQ